MEPERLCPNCMNEIKEGSETCPSCGYDLQAQQEANPHALKPYTILQGKYLVGNVIGEGGFGITYIGFDLNLEVKIAIKEFYPNGFVTRESNVTSMVTNYTTGDKSQYDKWKESFVREARSLAKFSDLPGIVHVRDFFQENNTAYIVMEFVEGETLKSHLKACGGKISVDETLTMMRPVIQSLAKVHEAGIVHRDISPDNIMIQKGGTVKLIDFGAARDFGSEGEKSLSVLLKPGYAPEEQYRSKGNQGPWTDVYAMCATIYRCITGTKPAESMERMREDTLKKPSGMGIAIDADTENALMSGMAVYAEQRIKTMDELEAKLYTPSQQHGATTVSHTSSQTTDSDTNKGVDQAIGSITGGVDKLKKNTGDLLIKLKGREKYIVAGIVAGLLLIFIIAVARISGDRDTEADVSATLSTEVETETLDTNPSQAEPSELPTEDTAEAMDVEENEDENREDEYHEDEDIHRYEFYIADVTWEEAYQHAIDMGGYLIHLNTDSETAYILEELNSSDYKGISFFIGGRRDDSNGYHWINTKGELFGDRLDDDSYIDRQYWLPGEPSYSSEGKEEYYMDMIYKKDDDRWYWNDIPNDLIQASRSFAGKIGYIVEFENNDESEGTEQDEYIVNGSDKKYYDKTFFEGLSDEELRLARNEIYARHGRMFREQALQSFFESRSWYEPKYSPDEFDAIQTSILNDYEISNRDLIVEVERDRS